MGEEPRPTRRELCDEISTLHRELKEAAGTRQETRWLEEALRERTRALNERVKELECLYDVARVAGDRSLSSEERLKRIVDRLPGAMQHPQAACARLSAPGRSFESAGFAPPARRVGVSLPGGGTLEVGYRAVSSKPEEDPFLPEERRLIECVAEIAAPLMRNPG